MRSKMHPGMHASVGRIALHVIIAALVLMAGPTSTQSSKIVFKLMEEQPTDTLIGNVAIQSGIENDVSAEVFRGLRYQILSSDGLRISSLFTINSVTGALFTNAMINREKVCDSTTTTCSLEFDVTVTSDVTVIRLLNVMVDIEDKNDNAPSFQSRELPLSVSEASPINSEISISGAIDRDTGLDTVITYWMDQSDVFGLREEKLLDVSILKIVLLQKLDREVENAYQLRIYAKDGNTTSALTGTLMVDITVTDVNDHDPKFVQSVYNFTVKENYSPDDFVGSIKAVDLDAGENGEIVYSFSSLTSVKVLQLFSLNSSSGEITVKSGLEYESNKKFQAVVEAKDRGGSPRASQAVLILNVVDAGNTPPKLSLTLADPLFQETTLISEDLPVGSFVGTLKYLDNDEGNNGVVECVSKNRHFSLQSLEDNGYGIEIKSKLDREAENEMKIKLQCSDRGQPSLSSFVNFTVIVSDINDNAPVFLKSEYTVSVSEGHTTAPNILRVSATDRDEGQNSKVVYQLTANSSNSFSVDPFTGWLSLTGLVDRESGPTIKLTVLGIDKGTEPKTGSVQVKVTIEDINDNPPEIIRTEYSARENSRPGSYVSHIVAADNDSGVNGEVVFSLLSDPSNSFAVSSEGVITTKKELDRESVPYYYITVSAHDKGIPSLSSTATITLTVLDGNDHKPEVIFPTPSNGTVTISANLSPGNIVAKAKAQDDDIGKNGKLMYLIVEGNVHKVFSIDNTTGTVFVSKRLTTFRETFYRLTILIQDGGNPRMYTEAYLKIKIDFTNATMLEDMSEMEQKYVIIAGIISGITIVIAIIVIAIIFKLRRSEPRLNPPPARKSKEGSHLTNAGKVSSEIHAHAIKGFATDNQADKEAGFDPKRGSDLDPNISFDSHLGNGNVTFTQRSAMTQEYVDRHSGQHFHSYAEGRQPLASEDLRSDTSGETITSDSGKGASDAEDSGVNSSHAFHAKPTATKLAPQVPPREPLHMAASTPTTTNSAPNVMYPDTSQQRGLSTFGDLSRAERAYASQKYFDKPKKIPGKVRFSFDDQTIEDSRHLNSHVVHFQPPPQNNYTNIKQNPAKKLAPPPLVPPPHSISESNDLSRFKTPTSLDNNSVQKQLNNVPNALTHAQYSQPKHNGAINIGGGNNNDNNNPNNNNNFRHPSQSSTGAHSQPHTGNNNYRNRSLGGGIPLQEDAMARQNLNAKHHSGHSSNYSKNVSYPLLRPPRSSMPLSMSLDEEDDDGGSTTTSGSYAIDDQLNISVEC